MLLAQPKTSLDYLSGMPPYMMMVVEARLEVRIRESIYESGKISERGEPGRGCMMGMAWRSLWAMEADDLATHVLHRMMEKRMNYGRQWDSILEASRKAFAVSMFRQQLGID
jgi:hypothetical protein